jgi:hypothetical protein
VQYNNRRNKDEKHVFRDFLKSLRETCEKAVAHKEPEVHGI